MQDDPFNPIPGVIHTLQSGLRRVLAPNPSPMTYRGTNTYLVGVDNIAVIDPGPDDLQHMFSLLAAFGETPVTHIFVTHSHIDHSPLAKPLSEETGARIVAFGDSRAGQSDVMRKLAHDGFAGGGEGIDQSFRPDVCLADGDAIKGDGWNIRAIHTPGHMGNHLCYAWDDALFTGDLVMGWASSMVSPPDGDLGDFMESCRKLQGCGARTFYPGHGAPINNPQERLSWLISHRESRTTQIVDALDGGPASVAALTRQIYTDAPAGLLAAASRNVFAHLVDLHGQGHVSALPRLSPDAEFARI